MKISFSKKEKDANGKKDESIPEFAQSPRGFIIELVKIVLIALAVIIPIRYFLFQPFYVRGASMEPNFYDNEYLIIDEITYRFSSPQRGDVVVVKNPQNSSEYFIKRIIAMPEEKIEINDGQVIIYNQDFPDGLILEEPYLSPGTKTQGFKTVTLGEEDYYVLGDNRSVSLDSRSFGPLPGGNIVGRAWLRVWPFSDFQHFTGPEYDLTNT